MAACPRQDCEPKAPDKHSFHFLGSHSSDIHIIEGIEQEKSESISPPLKSKAKPGDKNTDLTNLDDGQLQALLEEAYQYKLPKDRQGKSDLFQELLKQAEESESGEESPPTREVAHAISASNHNNPKRKKEVVSENAKLSGSLQNIKQPSDIEGANGSKRKKKKDGSLALRQREGGSLPPTKSEYIVNERKKELLGSYKSVSGGKQSNGSFKQSNATKQKESAFLHCESVSSFRTAGNPEHTIIDMDGFGEKKLERLLNESERKRDDGICSWSWSHSDCCEPEQQDSNENGSGVEETEMMDIDASEEEGEADTIPLLQNHERYRTDRVGQQGNNFEGKEQNEPKIETMAMKESEDVDDITVCPLQHKKKEEGITDCRMEASVIVNGIEDSPSDLQTTRKQNTLLLDPSNIKEEKVAKVGNMGSSKDGNEDGKQKNRKTQSDQVETDLDENGNPVNQSSNRASVEVDTHSKNQTSSLQPPNKGDTNNMSETEKRRKHRKTKANNEKNVMKSEEVVGYRGSEAIESLVQFIESPGEKKGKQKTVTAAIDKNNKKNNVKKEKTKVKLKEKGSEKKGSEEKDLYEPEEQKDLGNGNSAVEKKTKARSEEMKPVIAFPKNELAEKLKRSTSLEEISQTRMFDPAFQVEIKKQSTFDNVMDTDVYDTVHNLSVDMRKMEKEEERKRFEKKEEEKRKLDNKEEERRRLENKDDVKFGLDKREDRKNGNNYVPVAENEVSVASRHLDTHSTAGVYTTAIPVSGFVEDFYAFSDIGSQVFEDNDFRVVTKKQRKKKKRSSTFINDNAYCRDSGYGYSARRKNQNDTGESAAMLLDTLPLCHRQQRADRRKSTSSVPPSDHSDSSDLDSIHSLPVSSTTPKPHIKQTSTSSGSTPQASYADIAKMASAAGSEPRQPAFGNGFNKVLPTPFRNPSSPVVMATNGSKTGSPPSNSPQVTFGQADNNKVSPSTLERNKVRTSVKTTVPDGNRVPGLKTVSASAQTPDYKKKDATTSTTLDKKVVVLNKGMVKDDVSQKLDIDMEKKKELNILEDYYPSLEESLDVRKVSKTVNSVSAIQIKTSSGSDTNCSNGSNRTEKTPDKKETEIRTVPNSDYYGQNSSSQCSEPDTVVSMLTSPLGVTVSSSASETESDRTVTVMLPSGESKNDMCSDAEIRETFTSSLTLSSNPKDIKVKTGKKTVATKCVPPVIIMDTSDSSGDASDFTFGFEVNEQLLAISDTSANNSGEQRNEAIECLPLPSSEDAVKSGVHAQVSSNITHMVNSKRTVNHNSKDTDVPKDSNVISQSSVADTKNQKHSDCTEAMSPKAETVVAVETGSGKDFALLFTEPKEPDTKCFNYNHIIDFIGQSWDSVMQEMECSLSKPGKVQYYMGN